MALVLVTLAAALLLLAALLWAGGGKTVSERCSAGIIEAIPEAPEAPATTPETLVVLFARLAYGLETPWTTASPEALYDRLDAFIEAVAAVGADVVVVQEVDFASQRTYGLDQLTYIATALGWKYLARAFTWECRYLPWPPRRRLGRLSAGMGVLSPYPLVQNVRQRLTSSVREPLLAALFAPFPLVQLVDVQCGRATLRLLSAALSPRNGATRRRQAQELVDFVCQVAAPACLLVGPYGSAEVVARLRTGLGERLRPVSVEKGGEDMFVFVGSGVQCSRAQFVPTGAGQTSLVLHLRWTSLPGHQPRRNENGA
ncbi:MAG: hypothetical protein KatS3mg131_0752 [Candidatus Tectimicrobiota bacterium]|nr:MAG: hypothetical protein KatS3mg131_0752 [Candidatus Tectomicrobia bacterium]